MTGSTAHLDCNEVITPPLTVAGVDRAAGPVARAEIALVRLYQLARGGHPSPCRYLPSCSQYATEALARHGALRGSWLAARRIGRCHPWGGYGADPIPE
jgi:putative membrane protein insertion efficiency factor